MNLSKKETIAVLLIVVLALGAIIGSGLMKKTDMVLYDYSVSEDGSTLTFQAVTTSAIGRARDFKEEVKDGAHYLTYYRTFGFFGFHATEVDFELALSEEDTAIYFNRPGGEFELVLEKDPATGEWVIP